MSASFYDLMKYAKTGIASPDMTSYDKMRAVAMGGGTIKTLTGVPPLSFTGNGKPLISLSMLGNGQQSGTPAPDAPIMPEFVGERTENLFDESAFYASITSVTQQGTFSISGGTLTVSSGNENVAYTIPFQANDGSYRLYVQPNTTYYVNFENSENSRLLMFKNGLATAAFSMVRPTTITTDSDTEFYTFRFGTVSSVTGPVTIWIKSIMLNTGPTALQYEPYGYKIPITCAGQTVPIYLGQTQTVRRIKKLVLTGEEDWSTQNVGPNRAVSIRKDELPLAPNMQAGTLNILSTHFKSIGNVSQLDIGKMASGSSYLNFDYDGINNVTNFKQWLASQYAAGTPVTIWYVLAEPETAIVNEPLAKIGNYADELHSEDAGVSIPTAKGANTLTVDTELQPSSMTITYRE